MVPHASFFVRKPEKTKINTTTRVRTALKLLLTYCTRKIKSNPLEPHFQTSATMSRCLERTKTAVALPHCSESTRDSITGWWTFLLEVTPELWRNYGTSYGKKTEVEVIPVVDLFVKSAFQTFFAKRHRPLCGFCLPCLITISYLM